MLGLDTFTYVSSIHQSKDPGLPSDVWSVVTKHQKDVTVHPYTVMNARVHN